MKWVANTYPDPRTPDVKKYSRKLGLSPQSYQDWLVGKVIGEPQATEKHDVAALKQMGMAGVYVEEPGDSAPA